ncbi:MAG: ATP-binding protein [bacterium]
MSIILKPELKQKERVITSIVYLFFLFLIFWFYLGNINIFNQSADESVWFFGGFLMLIFSSYVAKEYFQKPANSIANATTVIITLLAIQNKNDFILYNFISITAGVAIITGLVAIFCKDSDRKVRIYKTEIELKKIPFYISIWIGSPEFIFSVFYLLATFSYFPKIIDPGFVFAITFWILFMFFDVVGLGVKNIYRIKKKLKDDKKYLGQAVGCENPFLYKVDIKAKQNKENNGINFGDIVSFEENKNSNNSYLGMIVRTKHFLDKIQIVVYLLKNSNGEKILKEDRKEVLEEQATIFDKENKVYKINLNSLSAERQSEIKKVSAYQNKDNFVGYVSEGSDIDKINFIVFNEFKNIKEGSILKTYIQNKIVYYQVINGKTKEENLEGENSHGYITGIAKKIGSYDEQKNEIQSVNWLPEMYEPIFKAFDERSFDNKELQEIADVAIGRLPETNLKIPINDLNSLVTHNTAILGILGIGKSCLVFELLQKIAYETNTKIICIDITNEYINSEKGLPKYIDINFIKYGVSEIVKQVGEEKITIKDSKEDGGNVEKLKELLKDDLKNFMQSDKIIRIINPEEIIAIQQRENSRSRNKNGAWEIWAPFSELTLVELSRVISECALEVCKDLGMISGARLLLVFEEAHSLIPEWNSVACDGDKNATNGIAKVILQGRKYGLGSFVITQRTANITKTILNQCNTIFAMRIFDDTGKEFLENYIGKDYANTLPNLEERQALAIGKGLKIKKPIIIQLNDKKYLETEKNVQIKKFCNILSKKYRL